ncbi:MAG: DUF4440 domain-containing protein [Ignavibacteriaceae bacterium]|jgi:ketosteroid isomerase-like protein|nr:DUF4440 domain-containing protein [Ignavibacteriaceae bacterium]
MLKKSLFLFCLFVSVSFAQVNVEKEKEAIKKADIEFSNLSVKEGFHKAFLAYVADDGVLLRPNSYPFEGRKAIEELYSKSSDSSYTLIWKPSFADVSSSGDMGYTYGTWELKVKTGDDKPIYGTYATFWKKDKTGKWKFVLDTGNDGLSKEEN